MQIIASWDEVDEPPAGLLAVLCPDDATGVAADARAGRPGTW